MSNSESNIQEAAAMMEHGGYAPNPFCTICGGYGQVHPRLPDGKINFAATVNCSAPGCMGESFEKYKTGTKYFLTHGLTTWSHMFSKYKRVTGTDVAFNAFYAFANGNSTPFLFCYGGVGNGKTFLTEAATIKFLQRGVDAWYYTVSSLMGLLHKAISDNSVDDMMRTFYELPALMLDDWKDLSDWEEGKLGDIIDERYRWHRITCLTSNRPLEQLMQRNERVVSRFMDTELSMMVLNQGADYRPQKTD